MAKTQDNTHPEVRSDFVLIPAPGVQSVRNPSPTANSPAPFLGGWGPPRVTVTQVVETPKPEEAPIRVETLSAAGYLTLVESEYAQSEELRRRIPFSFFQYFMVQVWWRKTLDVKLSTRGLSTEESRAHNALLALGDIPLTSKISDYFRVFSGERLSTIGGMSLDFSGSIGVNGYNGFLSFLSSFDVRVDTTTMWIYALFPVPGVALSAIFRDFVRAVSCGASEYECFSQIRPQAHFFVDSTRVIETGNILCWRETGYPLDLENVRNLCFSCGLTTIAQIPQGFADQSTNWLIVPSIIAIVRSAIESADLGVVGIESIQPIKSWNRLQENYICVKQTEESLSSIIEAPSFWNAASCGSSVMKSDHRFDDLYTNFLIASGFGVEINFFGDDGTTNHSPWYGSDDDRTRVSGPIRSDLLGCKSLVLSWPSGLSTHTTFHTEAVRRLEFGSAL